LPDNSSKRAKWWLYYIMIMIFSPLIVFYQSLVSAMTNCLDLCRIEESDSVLVNLLLYIPLTILMFFLKLAIVLPLITIFTPYYILRFIYDNTKQFKKIMNYWSSKNRFKGDARVKAELFLRRSSSQSRGRRPTLRF